METRPGRPRKGDTEKRSRKFMVRLTEEEYERLADAAKADQRTVSDYARITLVRATKQA